MQAVRVHEGGRLVYEQVPDPEPKSGEVVVELEAAALNRRDLFVRSGIYPFPFPLIPGSDGAGVGRDTGEEVVILPGIGWGDREDAPAEGFEIIGGPRNGTYAELIALPEENLFPKPIGFSWAEAAAFPLAAVTAYRALFTRGRLRDGRDRSHPGSRERRLDLRRAARRASRGACARDLVLGRQDRASERARCRRGSELRHNR